MLYLSQLSIYYFCLNFKKRFLKHYIAYLFVFFLALVLSQAYCQVDRGGVPRSFQLTQNEKGMLPLNEILPPDKQVLEREDTEDAGSEKLYRVGVEIPVLISDETAGKWDVVPGGRVWRMAIKCSGAQALGLSFDKLWLPDGTDLFIYTPDHQFIIGAIIPGVLTDVPKFATRPLPGDEVVVEYFQPFTASRYWPLNIRGISYQYRGYVPLSARSASATLGACEVNVNCSEGDDWQNQKKGVVKIYTKVNNKYFYCSGTLLNNTSGDFSALLLTASHCGHDFSGQYATAEDLAQWVFYFNYESPGCATAGSQEYTVVGATKLAISDDPADIGSDFFLLKLLTNIPASYYPYYCGWDASQGNSPSGVGIHHPNGEVKKISTYTTPVVSATWGSTPNTHWAVKWSATLNGHGVTEGGSSGSALFDNEKLVIATLTGGESSCSNTSGLDYYGKFSYSWLSCGTTASRQLKPWLDPANTGIVKLNGTYNEKAAVADFSANYLVIPVGGTVGFTDLSAGKPDKWHWYFEGGEPTESTQKDPGEIRFGRYGMKNVKLVVSNSYNSDSLIRENYIDVRAVISPNPAKNGVISILTDINNQGNIVIDVYDLFGKLARHFEYTASASAYHSIQLPEKGSTFIVRVIQGNQVQTHKVIVVH